MSRLISPSLVALAAVACSGARGTPAPADAPAALIRVAPVSRESFTPPVSATGTLAPKEEIALSFKIGGVISRIAVDAGATVKAGDTLASLDLSEINAAVTRARSGADKALRDVARAERLYQDSVFTLSQLQDTRTQLQVARADLETAEFNRRYAVITAPAAGVVLKRQAEPGELVTSGRPVLVLGSRARGSVVRVGLADRDLVRVRRGDPAVVRFDALPERELTGRVGEIAAAADPSTGTYTVEITVPQATGLVTGLVGRVEIHPSTGQPTTLIPIEALQEADGDHGFVFVLSSSGSRAERRAVTVGFLAGDRVAITSGLDGVRQVITEGAPFLRDGQAVREAR